MTSKSTFKTYDPTQSLISQVTPMHTTKLGAHTVILFSPLNTNNGYISLVEDSRYRITHKPGEISTKEQLFYYIIMLPLEQEVFFSEIKDPMTASKVFHKQPLAKLEELVRKYFC